MFFKQLDLFPKILQDQQIRRTSCGGILFLLTFVTILTLIVNELYVNFVIGELIIEQFIDSSNVDDRLRVNLNISFTKVPCNALTLDLQDVTGTHLEDVRHTLHKLRLDQKGQFIDRNDVQTVQRFEKYINYPSNPIFRLYKKIVDRDEELNDCYGAQLFEGQKCLTCQDVMVAYAARDWPQPPKEAIAQCMYDRKPHIKKVDSLMTNVFTINLATGQIDIGNVNNDFPTQILNVNTQDYAKDTDDEEAKGRRIIQENIKTRKAMLGITTDDNEKQEAHQPLFNDIRKFQDLPPQEHTDQFMRTLLDINELRQDPKYTQDQALNIDQRDLVQDLIDMMDMPVQDYDVQLKRFVSWDISDKVVSFQKLQDQFKNNLTTFFNITQLKRKLCDLAIEIQILISTQGEILNTIIIPLEKGVCEHDVQYTIRDLGEFWNQVQISIGGQQVQWKFQLNQDNLYPSLEFEILDVRETQTDTDVKTVKMFDSEKRFFRFSTSDYTKLNQNRKLFSEDFGQEEPKQQILFMNDIYDIQQHVNEGCQIFGHFFIKKVPGNFHISFHGKGQAAMLLANEFSIEHIIHLLEFTSEKEEMTMGRYLQATNPLDGKISYNKNEEDSQYYLKIVGGKYDPLWTEERKLYSFTAYESKTPSLTRLPQIQFKYEFDAITMSYYSKNRNIFQFLVSICAIIGGVFAVSSLVNSIMEKWDL